MRRTRNVVAIGATLELALVVIALVLGAVAGISPLDSLSWTLGDVAIGAIATVPLLAIFHVTWESGAPMLREIRDELERRLPDLFGDASTAGLALISLAAGIGEEVLFRGFLQTWLESLLGASGGLVVASLLFGFAHPITAAYVAIAAVMGAYLGLLWQASGNLLAPILTHALYDWVVLQRIVRQKRG